MSPRRGEDVMVPPADFRSYYGRPILKRPVWTHEIAAYLFTGGLAAGSSLLAAGGDLTGRPGLRRAGRATAMAALLVDFLRHEVAAGRMPPGSCPSRAASATSPTR